MNWSRLTSLDAWKGVALEAAWKITSRQAAGNFTPTWPLNAQDLDEVSILWPTKYQWELATTWVNPIRWGLRSYVDVQPAEIPQTYDGIVLIEMWIQGIRHKIAIDYADRPDINESCARRCLVYFKMQFSCDGYGFDNVIPGGFIPFQDDLYTYLPKVRALADKKSYSYDVYG